MMTTSPTPTSTSSIVGSLCPNCGGVSLNVLTATIVSYQVVFDLDAQELVVVGESVGNTEWDEQSQVTCPSCHWQGALFDCL